MLLMSKFVCKKWCEAILETNQGACHTKTSPAIQFCLLMALFFYPEVTSYVAPTNTVLTSDYIKFSGTSLKGQINVNVRTRQHVPHSELPCIGLKRSVAQKSSPH